MALTKKDFEALAAIVREAHELAAMGATAANVARNVQGGIAKYAEQENPRFDATRFVAACQPKPIKE